MMQKWGPEAIRFMRTASEYGTYHEQLAQILMKWVPNDGHICDAGCGLGDLSLALAKRCREVTAVDRAEAPLEVLRERCNYSNVRIHCADLMSFLPSQPYDAMVFCYFGKLPQILQIAKSQCHGKVILVKRNCAHQRFSIGQPEGHTDIADTTESYLNTLGIPYEKELLSLELGQPFTSLEDAVGFFKLYDKSGSEITPEMIAPRLISTGREDYPLYLPEQRRMGIFVLNAQDI